MRSTASAKATKITTATHCLRAAGVLPLHKKAVAVGVEEAPELGADRLHEAAPTVRVDDSDRLVTFALLRKFHRLMELAQLGAYERLKRHRGRTLLRVPLRQFMQEIEKLRNAGLRMIVRRQISIVSGQQEATLSGLGALDVGRQGLGRGPDLE